MLTVLAAAELDTALRAGLIEHVELAGAGAETMISDLVQHWPEHEAPRR